MVVQPDAVGETMQPLQPLTPVLSRQGFYASTGLAVGFGARTPIDNAPSSPFSNESFQASTVLAPSLAVGYSFAGDWRAEADYAGFYSQASNIVIENGQFCQLSGNQVATNVLQFSVLKDIPLGSDSCLHRWRDWFCYQSVQHRWRLSDGNNLCGPR